MNINDVKFIPVLLKEPVKPEDFGKIDVADLVLNNFEIQDRDIVVISSKVVSILEGRCVSLDSVVPSERSKKIAAYYGKNPGLVELINREGKASFVTPGARLLKKKKYRDVLLSLAKPGLTEEEANRIMEFSYSVRWMIKKHGYMADNAGIDCQNVPEGYAVMLPENPRKTLDDLRAKIKKVTGKYTAAIVTDSLGGGAVLGIWDVPLAYSGIDPVERNWGQVDVFGRVGTGGGSNFIFPLSSMAGITMGNSNECTPIVIIRGFKYQDERPQDIGKNILTFPVSYLLEGMFWTIYETLKYFYISFRA
jgi:coenzyme F420-0:L-glutamate ligase / coenzyme F420-1:gamma-L-glutamate ligase